MALTTAGLSFCGLVGWGQVEGIPSAVPFFSAIPKPTLQHQAGKRLSRSGAAPYHHTHIIRKGVSKEFVQAENTYLGWVKINGRYWVKINGH